MKLFIHPRVLFVTLITCCSLWAGCAPPAAEAPTEPARSSDRGGIGLLARTQAVASPSQEVDARKSLAVTDTAILANFTLAGVLDQLAAQNANPSITGNALFRQLWDTQNPVPSQPDLPATARCSDNGNTLNGFPQDCRPEEGAQADLTNTTNINSYSAIGLYNRFDLAPATGEDCGEYRIVFGKTGGGDGRNFIIFEATLPNPRQDLGIEGCRPVQAFWRDLSKNTRVSSRATALRDFYFRGLPGYRPVIHMENYGLNSASVGQIRVNMFIERLWMLKEFKLRRTCVNGVCALLAQPVTVKTNPFGGLFNPSSPHPLAGPFQDFFVSQVPSLAVNDANTFNYSVPDMFNAGQSDAQNFGVVDDYVAQFGTDESVFRGNIQAKLNEIGSTLTPEHVVARAQALSCGGCHQRSNDADLGDNLLFPRSAFFVHNTESTEPGPDGDRFVLSDALIRNFLPFRKSVVEEFLSASHPLSTPRFGLVGSAVDSQFAYWVESSASGSVVKASLDSGGEQVLASGRPNPIAVATDGQYVYWTEAAGTVLQVPVSGGTITPLATRLAGLGGIATDGTHLYWTQGSAIVRMRISSGTRTTLFSSRVGLTGRIAVDGANLYWQEGDSIMKAAKRGGAPSLLLTHASITGLATDGSHLYLAENGSPGNLLHVPVSGGTPRALLGKLPGLSSVAVSSGHVVWTENTGPGAIMAKVKN